MLVSLMLLAGCQTDQQIPDTAKPAIPGVWESPAGLKHWKFTLLEDGRLSEIIRADKQRMVLEEGGLEFKGPDYLLQYIFGPCRWSYDELTRELKISIVVEDFYVKAAKSELQCMLIDEFKGPVSKDGLVWMPKWTATIRYNVPAPDNVADGGTLVFKKVQ